MHHHVRRMWDLPQSQHTPIEVYRNRRQHRREFLQAMGIGAIGLGAAGLLAGCSKPTAEEIDAAGEVPVSEAVKPLYPAKRNQKFEYGRPETDRVEAATYTNFYEFSTGKDSWEHVGAFEPSPWSVKVDGLCRNPLELDMDDIHQKFPLEERAYRFRCVETWAMCVPWTGFPMRELIKLADPLPKAKFVSMETFNRPDQAPGIERFSNFPWPYREGLSLEEATNELTLLATGIYGEPLPKQHGAPIRLVTPWKYGFKSIKSIVRITFTETQPATFWNIEWPEAYGFLANVEPEEPHPNWPQDRERMLGTGERYDTVRFNGYGDYVAKLYPS